LVFDEGKKTKEEEERWAEYVKLGRRRDTKKIGGGGEGLCEGEGQKRKRKIQKNPPIPQWGLD
jgi:hypothetical protein